MRRQVIAPGDRLRLHGYRGPDIGIAAHLNSPKILRRDANDLEHSLADSQRMADYHRVAGEVALPEVPRDDGKWACSGHAVLGGSEELSGGRGDSQDAEELSGNQLERRAMNLMLLSGISIDRARIAFGGE